MTISERERVLFVPHADAEHKQWVEMLDALIEPVGNDESPPLASLLEVMGLLIENHEDENVLALTEIE